MSNVFKQHDHHVFTWDKLGNIQEGRCDLGEDVPVLVYRMMEYSMNHVLAQEFGIEKADELIKKAGYVAGCEFAKNALDLDTDFDSFVRQLHQTLIEYKVGILRIEETLDQGAKIILTVAQDLDCSGLEMSNEVICKYDEGFISAILETYTKHVYDVKEVDCWANGARVCRFCCTKE